MSRKSNQIVKAIVEVYANAAPTATWKTQKQYFYELSSGTGWYVEYTHPTRGTAKAVFSTAEEALDFFKELKFQEAKVS